MASSSKTQQGILGTEQPVRLASTAQGGTANYRSQQQTGPYRGGLSTNFDFGHVNRNSSITGSGQDPSSWSDPYKYGYAAGGFSDSDADVRGLANASNELQNPYEGTSSAEQQALFNMYKGRVETKNSLAEQIAGSDKNLRDQQDVLTGQAGQALGEGLKNTRKNYNSRGLLYSGLRQGGEQQVKQGVAGSLDSGISGAKRDAYKSRTSAQNAYAAVDLANSQESLNLAHQAYDTASRNSIARMQAMQQLGQGVGAVAGAYYGSRGPSAPATAQPTQNFSADRNDANNADWASRTA